MASFSFKMPEDFLNKISKLGTNTDEILTKVLENGAEVVESEVKTKLDGIIGKDTKYPSKSTGTLQSSLGVTSVRQDKNGNLNIKVGFSGSRADGKNNAMIAGILEYGKSNQQAKPFIKPALRKSKDACVSKMDETLNQEVSKL